MVCTWVKPAGQHPARVVGGLGGREVNVPLYWVKHSQHWQRAAMALKPSQTGNVQNHIILVKPFYGAQFFREFISITVNFNFSNNIYFKL